jgi:hypothetical protein
MNTYSPDEHASSRADGDRTADLRPVASSVRPRSSGRRVGVGVDARKLWAGGAASAVVAGLVALVGVLVSRWLFKVALLAPSQDGAFGNVHTADLVLVAVAGALVATGLVQLLMLGTLRPLLFFGWIVALVTAIMVAFPFSTTAALDAKIATAVVNLAIGVTIGTLVGGVAARSVPRRRLTSGYPLSSPYDQGR